MKRTENVVLGTPTDDAKISISASAYNGSRVLLKSIFFLRSVVGREAW